MPIPDDSGEMTGDDKGGGEIILARACLESRGRSILPEPPAARLWAGSGAQDCASNKRLARQIISNRHAGPVGPLHKQNISRLHFVLHGVAAARHPMVGPWIAAERAVQFPRRNEDVDRAMRGRAVHLSPQFLSEMIG
jgi:hypothetical protein